MDIFYKAIEKYPNNLKLLEKQIDIYLTEKDWQRVIDVLEKENLYIQLSMDYSIYLWILYIIRGKQEKANEIATFINETFAEKIENDSLGYRKLILFDNGKSRIEYYKKLKKEKVNKLIITFDSINIVWDRQPFAFKFLSRQNVDIIAIRKKSAKDYQQDLTREDFVATVSPLVNYYKDKLAYGFSLGAYNALYFASVLNCRIFAIAPRISIHPIYGKQKKIGKYKFNQITLATKQNN